MLYFSVVTSLCFWILATSGNGDEKTSGVKISSVSQGAHMALSAFGMVLDMITKKVPLVNRVIFSSSCVEPPQECPNKNITFWYYSRKTAGSPRQMNVSLPQTLKVAKNDRPWKVIIHGYTRSRNEIPNPELSSAYFKRGDYNMISVDYEPLARDGCYIQAVHNVPLIAECVAQFLDALIDKKTLRSDKLHVIGFSLGAQIAGRLHNYMKHDKPKRITGLDPAAPLFDGFVNNKLSRDSAKFVDAIHTNALYMGKLENLGHVDFYVNGGRYQPGCGRETNLTATSCSHARAALYYAESINSSEGFYGIPCSSYLNFYSRKCFVEEYQLLLMGEFVPQNAKGTYYLQTNEKAPFALGKERYLRG